MAEHEPLQPLSTSQKEMLEEAVTTYQEHLTPEAAGYLMARGIGRDEALAFRLGIVADPAPGHEKYRGMLAIPYLGRGGQPLTVRFRCLAEHNHRDYFHGKYNTIKDDIPRMFNIGAVHQAGDEIHVTEGELDAVILNKLGLPAVAIPGANMWFGRHRRMLAGFNRVWVWSDPDDAGAELTGKITRALRTAKAVRLKADVTDEYLAHGAEHLLAKVKKED
ncbi:toprim domain-containing protein [Streptomyces sp. MBT42]|uniref:toprim domain-containing protein n=1 Tax=Streptomyces sp. MBT42 TaxID=1488373 RepID=UPI001E607281|nr:toprim domain-containing protein [Streptomyces sp. MBT42]MCD2462480.1 toprim domain-containing protein [Streptomyces sp. MBT42]